MVPRFLTLRGLSGNLLGEYKSMHPFPGDLTQTTMTASKQAYCVPISPPLGQGSRLYSLADIISDLRLFLMSTYALEAILSHCFLAHAYIFCNAVDNKSHKGENMVCKEIF